MNHGTNRPRVEIRSNPITIELANGNFHSNESYFQKEFEVSDWTLNGLKFQLFIPQAEHMLQDPFVMKLEIIDSGNYETVSMYDSYLLPNGSIRILSDLSYSGRILLKGGI